MSGGVWVAIRACGCGAFAELLIDGIHLLVGRAHQALNFGSDFRLQVVFQNLSLFGGEQFAALCDLVGQSIGQGIGSLRPVEVDDMNRESSVIGFRGRLMAQRTE
jgi:hypothetical protein